MSDVVVRRPARRKGLFLLIGTALLVVFATARGVRGGDRAC